MGINSPVTPASDTFAAPSAESVPDIPKICQGRCEKTAHAWETNIISEPDREAIRQRPCIHKFDAFLLILIESWFMVTNKLAPLESGDASTDGYWPYAMTTVNHLVMRCHNIIYRHYMCFPRFRRYDGIHVTRSVDSTGRGVPESDIAVARLAIVELASVNFGPWLEKFEDGDVVKFRDRLTSFNVSFKTMDIEWVFVDDNGDFQHLWAGLPLGRLFPTAKVSPEEFSGQALQKKQRSKPLTYFGKWSDVDDTVSELDLAEESIGWKVSPTAKIPDSKDRKENPGDVSGGSSRPKMPEPGATGLSTAPLQSREDWFFPFMRSLIQSLESLNMRVAEVESLNLRAIELEDDLSEVHSDLKQVRVCLEKLTKTISVLCDNEIPDDELVHVSEESLMQEYLLEGRQ
ncbi:hypothetical protein F5B17DRAFT_381104 [Nemania serpens]|nr:hypothetical protein F5B17DRAFT_381104 [Nemania serpens]